MEGASEGGGLVQDRAGFLRGDGHRRAKKGNAGDEVMVVNSSSRVPGKGDIPESLLVALAKNSKALEHFVSLPPAEREAMIAGVRAMGSPEELQAYVDNMPWQSPSRQ